jgi:hypothetical protein
MGLVTFILRSKTLKRSVTERVKRGIQKLDNSDKVPNNWRSLVKPKQFMFANPDYGPAGQLFANDYYRALHQLRITVGGDQFGFRNEFNKPGDSEALKKAWEKALRTDKTWTTKVGYKYRYIKGVRYHACEQRSGRIAVWEFKPGRAVPFYNTYINYDSAMRAVRKQSFNI